MEFTNSTAAHRHLKMVIEPRRSLVSFGKSEQQGFVTRILQPRKLKIWIPLRIAHEAHIKVRILGIEINLLSFTTLHRKS